MRRMDNFKGTVKGAAERILSKLEKSKSQFESVQSDAENALEIFDPASYLGENCILSSFDPYDIKRKPMTIILVTDPTTTSTKGAAAGLALDVLTNISLQAQRFEPRVTILADEFASLSKGVLPSIEPTLFLGRDYGTQLITYVQDTSSFEPYGKNASAFTSQAEIVMAWKCSNIKDAEEYSKKSGIKSVMTENMNLSHKSGVDNDNSYSIGMSEKGLPRMRADEFLHMEDYKAALFYKQIPTVVIDLISYQQVLPWRDQAGVIPDSQPTEELPIKFDFTN